MQSSDVIVVGGGIAGASAAYSLAGAGAAVTLLEREDSLAAHSTGRSAAQYLETYGGPLNQVLSIASREFLTNRADGWATDALLTHRPVLWVAQVAADDAGLDDLQRRREETAALSAGFETLTAPEARRHCAALDPAWVAGGLLESDGYDIDVAGLHQAFVRGARDRTATVVRGAGVTGISRVGSDGRVGTGSAAVRRGVTGIVRSGGVWTVATPAGDFVAPVLVNAAGAWADEVATAAGVAPVGLAPLRRTIFTFAAPANFPPAEVEGWPLVIDIADSFYFKPEGPGRLLASPHDEVPDTPGDARATEIDVARGIEAVNVATTFAIRAVGTVWAGLRTFAPDRDPVVGFDAFTDWFDGGDAGLAGGVEGFVWCAGQGGTGIQTSPAIGEIVASLICGTPLPPPLADLLDSLSPQRLRSPT